MPIDPLRAAWFTLSLACVNACAKPAAPGKPSAASAAAAAPVAPAASEASPPARPERVKPACRILAVTGAATSEGVPLAEAALLDGTRWVELAAGASLALRHTTTSREFKLLGPGHALPCRDGAEQILLADGQLSTSANLGVRPGAQVLIATPAGVVHYGDAALDLEFGEKGLSVRVKQGEAWVEPEAPGKPPFENPLRSGAEARWLNPRVHVQALVDRCRDAAEAAQASAGRVLSREGAGGSDSLGARAAAHMRERSKARAACAVAAAGAFGERDPAKRQSLSAAIAHADALWQSVPRRSTAH